MTEHEIKKISPFELRESIAAFEEQLGSESLRDELRSLLGKLRTPQSVHAYAAYKVADGSTSTAFLSGINGDIDQKLLELLIRWAIGKAEGPFDARSIFAPPSAYAFTLYVEAEIQVDLGARGFRVAKTDHLSVGDNGKCYYIDGQVFDIEDLPKDEDHGLDMQELKYCHPSDTRVVRSRAGTWHWYHPSRDAIVSSKQ